MACWFVLEDMAIDADRRSDIHWNNVRHTVTVVIVRTLLVKLFYVDCWFSPVHIWRASGNLRRKVHFNIASSMDDYYTVEFICDFLIM